jgi:DtxR family Mn-dependent transcriptional regulator
MAIDDLIARLGYARVSDVARALGITRGSVSISLQPLKKAGLVLQDENRHLRLSSQGQALVTAIKTKRHLIQRLLTDALGVPAGLAEVDACKIEHLVSNETAQHILSFLRFVDSNDPLARKFAAAWRAFEGACTHEPGSCPSCAESCMAEKVAT